MVPALKTKDDRFQAEAISLDAVFDTLQLSLVDLLLLKDNKPSARPFTLRIERQVKMKMTERTEPQQASIALLPRIAAQVSVQSRNRSM